VDRKSPGITCTLLKNHRRDKLCEVAFNKVKVSKKNIIGKLDQAWEPLEKTLQQVNCCQIVLKWSGALKKVLEMSADHTKQRIVLRPSVRQFPGHSALHRPIYGH